MTGPTARTDGSAAGATPSHALVARFRHDACGDRGTEAAVELLVEHGRWMERSDFVAACIDAPRCRPGGLDGAAVRFAAVPSFLEDAPCASSEARVLRLAAELAGIDTGHALAELLSGLDDRNRSLALNAVTRTLGLDDRDTASTRRRSAIPSRGGRA